MLLILFGAGILITYFKIMLHLLLFSPDLVVAGIVISAVVMLCIESSRKESITVTDYIVVFFLYSLPVT